MKFHVGWAVVSCIFTGWALAKPELLADFGGRQTEFPTSERTREALVQAYSTTEIPDASAPLGLVSQYPIVSALQVGVVETEAHSHKINRPVFIVGPDARSLEWLLANQEHLAEINALGIVTNVKSADELSQLRSRVARLQLTAVPVDDLAKLFEITHYPVLIDSEGVKQ